MNKRNGIGLLMGVLACGVVIAGELITDDLTVLRQGKFWGGGQAVLTNALSLFYTFATNEAVITDQSGMGNTGTVVGAVWTNDSGHEGVEYFDGGDYINVGDKLDIEGTVTALTVCAWIRPANTGEQSVVAKQISGNPYDGWNLMKMWDNKPAADLVGDSLSERAQSIGTTLLDTNQWHFIVGTYLVTTNSLRTEIYVNGVLEDDAEDVGAHGSVENSVPLLLGARTTGLVAAYKGWQDDVRIYTRVLAAWEILNLYYGGETTNLALEVKGRTLIEHMERQGDIEMGSYTNGP